jgi:hypothetical protein
VRKRWIQDPTTGRMVPANEYVRQRDTGPDILPPLEPFKSPVDGSIISCRSKLRAHNKRHGVTDYRDYGDEWFKRKARERELELISESARRERARDIANAMEQLRSKR